MSDLLSPAQQSVSLENASTEELYFAIQVNLIVLSKVQIDDHLDTSKRIFTIMRPSQYKFASVQVPVIRWWYSMNRQNAIVSIQQLYYYTSTLLENPKLAEDQKNRLKKHLVNSHAGIRHLMETYSQDPATQARLKCLIDETKKYDDARRAKRRNHDDILRQQSNK